METVADPKPARTGLLAPLRHRDFAAIWSGQAISGFGDALLPIAIAIGLLRQGRGAIEIGGMLGARSLAMVITMLVGGVLADRFRRARIMIVADLIRLVAVALITVALARGSVPAIVVLMFVFGLGEAFFRPAYRAIPRSVLPEELLQPANALSAVSNKTMAVIGPGAGALVVTLAGVTTALWIDVATFAVSTLLLLAVREPNRPSRPAYPSPVRDLVAGFREVVRRRWIGVELLAGFVQTPLAVAPWLILLPVIAVAHYGKANAYGLSLSAYAVGGLLGAVVAAKITPARPGVVAMAAAATFALPLAALAVAAPVWILVAAHVIAGAGMEIFGVLWYTALQREIPDENLAKVSSFDMLSGALLMPVSYTLVGLAAARIGEDQVLWVGAAACVLTSLPLLFSAQIRNFSSSRTARETNI